MGRGFIDVQHHMLPKDYVRAVGRDAIGTSLVSGRCPEWTPDVSLDAMDRNGITRAILSVAAPGYHFDAADRAASLARLCNEAAAAQRDAHPGRFGYFATLPLPHVEASLREIERVSRSEAPDGFCLLTNYAGVYPGDPRLTPVLDELDRRGAVVFVHPADLSPKGPIDLIPAATLEYPFDTTRAIGSLLFSGTLARLRRLRFIFSHAGGTLPFLADRIARLERRPDLARAAPEGVLAELRRHYYDIALSAGPRTLRPLLDLVPAERILFATDFPFAGEDTMAASIRQLEGQGLSPGTVAAIGRDNAQALLSGSPVASTARPPTERSNRTVADGTPT